MKAYTVVRSRTTVSRQSLDLGHSGDPNDAFDRQIGLIGQGAYETVNIVHGSAGKLQYSPAKSSVLF